MKSIMYSELTYRHPGEIDGEPEEVARITAGDLTEATAVFARHVVATVRQVRNGCQTSYLRENPEATPEEIAEAWESSAKARSCAALVRASKLANTAVKGL